MKTTFRITLALVTLLFYACSESDPVLDHLEKRGKFSIQTDTAPQKLIRLESARKINDGRTGTLTEVIVQDGKKEVLRQEYKDQDVIEVPYGTYEVILRITIIGGDHDGMTEFQGETEVVIDQGFIGIVPMILYRYAHDVKVTLNNLPDAIIWVGPKGFTPSDDFLYEEHLTEVYGEEFDVVVEFEGEQKRYTTEANRGESFDIVITRSEEPQEPTGNFGVEYEVEDRSIVFTEYTW